MKACLVVNWAVLEETGSASGSKPHPTPLQGLPCGIRVSLAACPGISSVSGTELVLGIETGVRCVPALKKISLKWGQTP